MAEQREFETVICVKNSANPTRKIELFPAEQWKDGPKGKFRLRINRKWYEPTGKRYYLDPQEIGIVVMGEADPQLEVPIHPHIPVGTNVRVPTGKILAGTVMLERTQTFTEPFLGYDKRWYVAVRLFERGKVMVPVDELVWAGSPRIHNNSAIGTGTSEHSPQ